jgi:hypothetical protein
MSVTFAEHESAIMERLVISRESAKAILSLRFGAQDERRMQDLVDRNNKGALTADEQEEMESYRRIGRLLAILQARARVMLNDRDSDIQAS